MKRISSLAFLLVLGLALSACGGDTTRRGARRPGPAADSTSGSRPSTTPGQIAFASERDGNAEIYVVNADGTGARRLTDDPADDIEPGWPPASGAP